MMAEIDDAKNISQRFIVVDDDTVNNLISKITILRFSKNADVQLFTDPEIALLSIKKMICHTDDYLKTIILLDINMPSMSGWEFLDEFADFGEDILKQFTVYMLSSSIDRSDMERIDNHILVSGFFSKPLSSDKLHTTFGNVNSFV